MPWVAGPSVPEVKIIPLPWAALPWQASPQHGPQVNPCRGAVLRYRHFKQKQHPKVMFVSQSHGDYKPQWGSTAAGWMARPGDRRVVPLFWPARPPAPGVTAQPWEVGSHLGTMSRHEPVGFPP